MEAIYASRNSYSEKVTQLLLRSCVCRKPHITYSDSGKIRLTFRFADNEQLEVVMCATTYHNMYKKLLVSQHLKSPLGFPLTNVDMYIKCT